jgi:hypothetical protein
MTTLNSKVPEGPIKDKWTTYKDKELKLLNIFSQLELVSQKYLEIQHRY